MNIECMRRRAVLTQAEVTPHTYAVIMAPLLGVSPARVRQIRRSALAANPLSTTPSIDHNAGISLYPVTSEHHDLERLSFGKIDLSLIANPEGKS